MLPFWVGECGGSFRTRRSAPSPVLVLVRGGGAGRTGTVGTERVAIGRSQPTAQSGALTASSGLTPEPPPSFVGSCVVGVGRGQQRPVWSEAREAATSGGNQSAHQGRTTQANFGAGWRRFGRATRPPDTASDHRGNQPRCHRVAETREREFSRRTTNSRRDRDAGTHTTVHDWRLNKFAVSRHRDFPISSCSSSCSSSMASGQLIYRVNKKKFRNQKNL